MTNEEFKKTLWDTATKLRGSVSAAEARGMIAKLLQESPKQIFISP